MCTTAFKKMCRRLGIAKWPHRQLRGIDKRIAALKAELNYATDSDRQQFLVGLGSLEEEKARLAKGVLGGDELMNDSDSEPDEKDEEEEKTATVQNSDPTLGGDDSEEEDSLCEDEGQDSSGTADSSASSAGVVIRDRELRQHFHLPLHTAAQRFGICTTAFKKLCRRFGIAKWPHRQLRGIDKKIAALKAELNYATGDREGCWRSLHALQEEKNRISRSSSSNDSQAVSVVPVQESKRALVKKEQQVAPCALSEHESITELHERSCASALDLLAAVAGVKEEHDRKLAAQQRSEEEEDEMTASRAVGDACSSADERGERSEEDGEEREHGSTAGGELDTPPLAPLSPITPPLMSEFRVPRVPHVHDLLSPCTVQLKPIPSLASLEAFSRRPVCSS